MPSEELNKERDGIYLETYLYLEMNKLRLNGLCNVKGYVIVLGLEKVPLDRENIKKS